MTILKLKDYDEESIKSVGSFQYNLKDLSLINQCDQ